ncbi:PspC domain-containing protein [Ornithinicoccus halotolerans]|uniref:PspC domain-containing protein n=1 Tax=Ornithinicoccus halotolerans TaxID=1748220 RepID=UPI0012968AB6|nr:PspC domain-containing protein [Ornithinicoccus halotolerans]
MTSTPPPGTPGAAPEPPPHDRAGEPPDGSPIDRFFTSLRSIDLRRGEDRWLAGVCSGVAHRLGIDPAIVRVAFVLLALLGGFGVSLYLLGWLLVPEHDTPPHLERAVRGGEAGSIVLLIVTAIVALGNLPWWDAWGGGSWSLAALLVWVTIVLLAVWAVVWTLGRRQTRQGPAMPAPGTAPPPPPSPSGTTTTVTAPASASTSAGTPPAPSAATGAPLPPPPGGYPPAPPVRERRRGPGAALSLLVLGLALAVLGGLWWGGITADWPGNPFSVAVAGTLALLGAVVLALGLTGRRAGLAGGLAVLTLLATLLAAPAPDNYRPSTRFGEQTWRPAAAALSAGEPAEYRHGMGVAVLDLRQLAGDELPPGAEVHAWVDVGQLVVRVPEDMVVHVDGGTGVGAITLRDDTAGGIGPPRQSTAGLAITEQIVTGEGTDDPATAPDLDLRLRVGIGEVSVREDTA